MTSGMFIRSIDSSGDWNWGQNLQSFNFAEAAIEEDIYTRLLSFLNDCFWALNFGVDWWNLLGAKNPAAEAAILLQTRTMIITGYGVSSINSVDLIMNANTRKLAIEYDVDTIYSTGVEGSVIPSP